MKIEPRPARAPKWSVCNQHLRENVFSKNALPDDIPEYKINSGSTISVVNFICEQQLAPSKKEARRLIDQGAVTINEEKVTVSIGIPTIWEELLSYLEENNANIKSLKRIFAGGAKVPDWMITVFADQHDIKCVQAWGMTETSPLGTVNRPLNKHKKFTKEQKYELATKQGRPVYGVDRGVAPPGGKGAIVRLDKSLKKEAKKVRGALMP